VLDNEQFQHPLTSRITQ